MYHSVKTSRVVAGGRVIRSSGLAQWNWCREHETQEGRATGQGYKQGVACCPQEKQQNDNRQDARVGLELGREVDPAMFGEGFPVYVETLQSCLDRSDMHSYAPDA